MTPTEPNRRSASDPQAVSPTCGIRSSSLLPSVPFKKRSLISLLSALIGFRLLTASATAQNSIAFRIGPSRQTPQQAQDTDKAEPLQDPVEETVPKDPEISPPPDADPEKNEITDDTPASNEEMPLIAQRNQRGLTFGIATNSFYDSNIFIQSNHPKGDWINQFQPSFHLGLGDYVVKSESFLGLDYTARASSYTSNSSQDFLDHDVALNLFKQLSRLDLRAGLHVKTATDPNIDAGRRTESQLYQTTLNARYEFTGRTSAEFDFMARSLEYAGLLNSTEIRSTGWMVYRVAPHLDESLGVNYGDLWVSQGPRQTYEQVLSRARLIESSIITAGLNLGIEFRQFEETSKTKVNPVLDLAFDYDAHAGCVWHCEASRQTESSSLYVDQNRIETGLKAACRLNLTATCSASLAVDVGEVDYTGTNETVAATRRDLVYSGMPSLIYEPNEHWSATIFAQYRRNASTLANFAFSDIQTGFTVKIRF